eukprot:3885484-Prymnesium_polylepis.4
MSSCRHPIATRQANFASVLGSKLNRAPDDVASGGQQLIKRAELQRVCGGGRGGEGIQHFRRQH